MAEGAPAGRLLVSFAAQRALGAALVAVGVLLVGVGLTQLGDGDDAPAPTTSADAPSTTAATSTTAAPSTSTPTSTTGPSTTETSTTSTTTSTTVAVDDADPTAFLEDLAAAIRTGDGDFLLAHLSAASIDRYGEDACAAYAAGRRDETFELVVRSVGAPRPWDYPTDDLTTDVGDAVPVEATLTAGGQTAEQTINVQLVDGAWTWFTDCGDPLG